MLKPVQKKKCLRQLFKKMYKDNGYKTRSDQKNNHDPLYKENWK